MPHPIHIPISSETSKNRTKKHIHAIDTFLPQKDTIPDHKKQGRKKKKKGPGKPTRGITDPNDR